MRARIANGAILKFEDSEDIGNKYTTCTWGLCHDAAGFWEKEECQFEEPAAAHRHGRYALVVRSKHLPDKQKCPMDRGDGEQGEWGCSYRCRIFTPTEKRPDRKRALQLYDDRIKEVT